ncbi:MAG: ABC transporter ATP-binding protein [Candidatus Nanopelagicales bacterium]|nr:ABC transporter ATP-binding protein [Candidatus Nanopelagicales bacterium]
MTVDYAIRANGLTKSYGDVLALRGVDLEVKAGECFALLGPNGAGKTVTTEILEGYRRRDGGTADVLGIDPQHGDRHWKSRIGIVLQTARDLGELKVAEAVRHFASYYPNPADPDEVIDSVGLTEKHDSGVGKLSGGQRRRLDVALGIIGQPEVLFLDEPTTGFDPEARRHFWALINLLKESGTTIMLTTHYLDEAEHLADRVAVINRGRVLACDTPEQLGGRQMGSAEVSWLQDGTLRSQLTETPTRLVAELSERFGGEIPELSVLRPSLEDVYLRLVTDAAAITEEGTTKGIRP